MIYLLLDEEKTKEQKEREDQLIKELIELINEREWLDQRLTNTTQLVCGRGPFVGVAIINAVFRQSTEETNKTEIESTKRRSSLSKKLSLERGRGSVNNKECVIS